MCGRFTLTNPVVAVEQLFDLEVPPSAATPRFNIAPTQESVVVDLPPGADGPRVTMMRWGLVPHWAPDMKGAARMINARSETVGQKPAFRESLQRRRCLVPADGFYEWRTVDRKKHPHYIRLREGRPFAMAGIFSRWRSPTEGPYDTFSVLTTPPNALVAELHDRMPVIVPPAAFSRWLAPQIQSVDELSDLFVAFPAADMEQFEVDPRVNSPHVDDARCVLRAEAPKQGSLF